MTGYGYESLNLSRERDEMLARDKLEEGRRFRSLICSELHIFNKLMTIQPPASDEITLYFRDSRAKQSPHCVLCFCFLAYGLHEVDSASTLFSWTLGSQGRKQSRDGYCTAILSRNRGRSLVEGRPGTKRKLLEH